mmetsp:Transcript_43976/g.125400  ORF Transcript_43976/g.125400 Transcript_43976/m.125400 type:complete len:262 (+) Transcript_43976:724-1509(+)
MSPTRETSCGTTGWAASPSPAPRAAAGVSLACTPLASAARASASTRARQLVASMAARPPGSKRMQRLHTWPSSGCFRPLCAKTAATKSRTKPWLQVKEPRNSLKARRVWSASRSSPPLSMAWTRRTRWAPSTPAAGSMCAASVAICTEAQHGYETTAALAAGTAREASHLSASASERWAEEPSAPGAAWTFAAPDRGASMGKAAGSAAGPGVQLSGGSSRHWGSQAVLAPAAAPAASVTRSLALALSRWILTPAPSLAESL